MGGSIWLGGGPEKNTPETFGGFSNVDWTGLEYRLDNPDAPGSPGMSCAIELFKGSRNVFRDFRITDTALSTSSRTRPVG